MIAFPSERTAASALPLLSMENEMHQPRPLRRDTYLSSDGRFPSSRLSRVPPIPLDTDIAHTKQQDTGGIACTVWKVRDYRLCMGTRKETPPIPKPQHCLHPPCLLLPGLGNSCRPPVCTPVLRIRTRTRNCPAGKGEIQRKKLRRRDRSHHVCTPKPEPASFLVPMMSRYNRPQQTLIR